MRRIVAVAAVLLVAAPTLYVLGGEAWLLEPGPWTGLGTLVAVLLTLQWVVRCRRPPAWPFHDLATSSITSSVPAVTPFPGSESGRVDAPGGIRRGRRDFARFRHLDRSEDRSAQSHNGFYPGRRGPLTAS